MLRLPALLGLILLLASCVSPHRDPKLRAIEMPADFAIEFAVQGETESTDAMRQSAQYVVEANRRMRVLAGRRAETRTFPRFLRDLTPAEFESLWVHVKDTNLMSEPTSPGAEASTTIDTTTLPATPPPPPPDPTKPFDGTTPEVAVTDEAPAEPAMNPAVYHVAITARGQTHRYSTTPGESPPTVSLLAMLAELRDTGSPMVVPPGASAPDPRVEGMP
jgi:hypothetical protein